MWAWEPFLSKPPHLIMVSPFASVSLDDASQVCPETCLWWFPISSSISVEQLLFQDCGHSTVAEYLLMCTRPVLPSNQEKFVGANWLRTVGTPKAESPLQPMSNYVKIWHVAGKYHSALFKKESIGAQKTFTELWLFEAGSWQHGNLLIFCPLVCHPHSLLKWVVDSRVPQGESQKPRVPCSPHPMNSWKP